MATCGAARTSPSCCEDTLDTFHVIFTTSKQRTFEHDVEADDAVHAAQVARTLTFAEDADQLITHLLVRVLRDDHL